MIGYVAIQDVGKAVNPAGIEEQIHGGVAQGIGWALYEGIVLDDDGRVVTGSLLDYALPTADKVPPIETVLLEVPSRSGPFGVRGVGEPPVIPGAAAIGNAIRDAVGVRPDRDPDDRREGSTAPSPPPERPPESPPSHPPPPTTELPTPIPERRPEPPRARAVGPRGGRGRDGPRPPHARLAGHPAPSDQPGRGPPAAPVRLATREQRFLAVADRLIYGHPGSPYLRLMRHAGCEPGDLRALVGQEGIEGALKILADRGVYVSFAESKGRAPAVRGSQRFTFRETDFDNPYVRPVMILRTGGSGGRPSRIRYSLPLTEEWASSIAIAFEAHGIFGQPEAYWWPIVVQWLVSSSLFGIPVRAWFYPVHPLPMVARLAGHYLALVARLGGGHFPTPPGPISSSRSAWSAGWPGTCAPRDR